MIELLIDSENKRREAIGGLVLLDLESTWKLKVTKTRKNRTIKQNRALHLLFKHIAIELNRLGLTFNYTGLKGLEMEMPYTESLVKETIWRPIQITMFEIESTIDLITSQINSILDVLTKFFGDRGVQINFPSKIDLIAKEFTEKGYY